MEVRVGIHEVRVGGACGPPPPVAAALASSLRAPSRGDPPLKLLVEAHVSRAGRWVAAQCTVVCGGSGSPDYRCTAPSESRTARASPHLSVSRPPEHDPTTSRCAEPPDYGCTAPFGMPNRQTTNVKRGVAAGRSAQRACERSSDWRRGAAGSPDPDFVNSDPDFVNSDPDFVNSDPDFVKSGGCRERE